MSYLLKHALTGFLLGALRFEVAKESLWCQIMGCSYYPMFSNMLSVIDYSWHVYIL